MRRHCILAPVLAIVLAATLSCCAPRGLVEGPPALERTYPVRERVFRHAVRITIPGDAAPFSFTGIMRYRAFATQGGPWPEIQILCLGALGLTLCDMTLSPTGHTTNFLHPSLAKVPEIEKHIARCVTAVWFTALPARLPLDMREPVREVYAKTLLEHAVANDAHRTTRALGPKLFWTVTFLPEEPQPSTITFANQRPEYSVTIRFVEEQGKGETRP